MFKTKAVVGLEKHNRLSSDTRKLPVYFGGHYADRD